MKKDLEKANEKVYKISDIMAKLKLTARAIRYYDSESLLGEVKRSIGYTRYFTDSDIERLREIKRLKKRGLKIAEIKTIFKEKYSLKSNNTFDFIEISDVYITQEDIPLCQELKIKIISSEIKFSSKNIATPYMNWQSVDIKMFNEPFKITSKPFNKSDKLQFGINLDSQWVGNAARGILNYVRKNKDKPSCTRESIEDGLAKISEWLILPVQINTNFKHHNPDEVVYMIHSRSQNQTSRNIIHEDGVLDILTKQIKDAAHPFNGVMKQVTIHSNASDKKSTTITNQLKKLIPHKVVLDNESLTPFYKHCSGSDNAIFISMF